MDPLELTVETTLCVEKSERGKVIKACIYIVCALELQYIDIQPVT